MRTILFPGQGAQAVGMGQDFFERSDAAKDLFRRADEVLGMELSKVCFEGPEERLAETDICQPAILTCSAAIVSALQERGLLRREDFGATAGLSLGEYTALWFAGALRFEDAVRLVRIRGRAMQQASEASPSGMMSLLGATSELAVGVCEKYAQDDVLVPANYLAPGNIVVSGAKAALERLAENARGEGIKRAIPLKVAGAFHSALMAPALDALKEALADTEIREPALPVISNVTAAAHADPESIRETLARQVTAPVRWEDSMRTLIGDGVAEFLEPGPGTVLTGLLRKIDRGPQHRNVARMDELEEMAQEGSEA